MIMNLILIFVTLSKVQIKLYMFAMYASHTVEWRQISDRIFSIFQCGKTKYRSENHSKVLRNKDKNLIWQSGNYHFPLFVYSCLLSLNPACLPFQNYGLVVPVHHSRLFFNWSKYSLDLSKFTIEQTTSFKTLCYKFDECTCILVLFRIWQTLSY